MEHDFSSQRLPICALPDDLLVHSVAGLSPADKRAVRLACARARKLVNVSVRSASLTSDDVPFACMLPVGHDTNSPPSEPAPAPATHLFKRFPCLSVLKLSDGVHTAVTDFHIAHILPLPGAPVSSCAPSAAAHAAHARHDSHQPPQQQPFLQTSRPSCSFEGLPSGHTASLCMDATFSRAPQQHMCLASLRNLDLKRCHYLTELALRHVTEACRGLTHLAPSRWADASALAELQGLPRLQYLDLGDAEVDILSTDDTALLQVAHLTSLRGLSLRRCVMVSSQAVHHVLSCCTKLEVLDLSHCSSAAHAAAFAAPLHCHSLLSLEASGCRSFGDAALAAAAAAAPKLCALRIADTAVTNSGIVSVAAGLVCGPGGLLRNLTRLSLGSHFELTDEGIAAVAGLPRLERLSLGNFNLTRPLGSAVPAGPGCSPLFPCLRDLQFGSSMNYPNRGISYVFPLPGASALERVVARGMVVVADAVLKHVARQKSLKHLELYCGYHLTPQGLAPLTALPQLVTLKLVSCPLISQASLSGLTTGCPSLQHVKVTCRSRAEAACA